MTKNDAGDDLEGDKESSAQRPSRWGSPPPWVDWIHKLGPLIGIIGGLTLFGVTWHLTVDPVYKRALLEERNAKLEIERDGLDKDIKKLEQRQADLRAALKSKEADVQVLQETIFAKEKEAALLTTELGRSKDELSDAEKRLRQARAEADKAFDVLRVKTMTAFEDRVLNTCLLPALTRYSHFSLVDGPAAPPQSFARFGVCFTSVLKSVDLLHGLPEMERHQFRNVAARRDKNRVAKLLSLDQELKRISGEAARLFIEAKNIQINLSGGPTPGFGGVASDSDEYVASGKELLRSLELQEEATRLLSDAMPRFFEQYKATIVQDLAILRTAFLSHRLEP